ncbi:polyphenol oxidase family protein [Bifidobacterium cuniculi]|uniref:Multicopper polyphenol oxidase n=1 Tax=Bifidobacterium cuniculi TaxID=1688 RepID=A0A087AY77_9BIFI|nr:polyphenol oxidase family protein [Bifidobacterium cuniculi]KFI63727.1 multicopper polyphenol oxidase [Bifidobacterium cuniculi]
MSEHNDNAQPEGERTPVRIDLQQLLEAVQAHGQKTVDQQDEAAKDGQYDDAILDSSAIAPTDDEGNPVPVTIPIVLAPGVTVVYTTRLGGVSEGDFAHFNLGAKGGDLPERVRRNREALANELHARISLVNQVHSATPVDLDDLYEENAAYGFNASGMRVPGDPVEVDAVDRVSDDGTIQVIDADAQVTTRTGIALGVFAADCLPVLLADPEAGVTAAAHAGRKGLVDGVIDATVDMMVDKGAQRGRIVATLGPAICGDCYEVGDEIADAFDAVFPGTFTLTRFGGPGIDINKAALIALAKAGVDADRVFSSQPRVNAATQYLSHDAELEELCREDNEGDPALAERLGHIRHSMCTLENPLWFSHRRAQLAQKPHEGRMLALIVRR